MPTIEYYHKTTIGKWKGHGQTVVVGGAVREQFETAAAARSRLLVLNSRVQRGIITMPREVTR